MAYETTAPRVKGSRTPKSKKPKLTFFVGLVLGFLMLDALNAFSGLIALLGR
jgi:hypothetical protein